MYKYIVDLAGKVLQGGEITFAEAERLTTVQGSALLVLLGMAGRIRDHFRGDRVELCSIISAKTGNCPENCRFCAQSAHYDTKINVHSLMPEEEIVARAKEMEKAGADRFDIVISGLGVHHEDPEFQKILSALRRIKAETKLAVCACLGTLTPEAARQLAAAGVSRYNHNLQTARSFFSQIISSHTYEERLATIKLVRQVGMETCCGGIIGMGESWRQRVELAFELKEVGVEVIPLNFLDAIPGTPLAKVEPLTPLDILKTIAIFRFILPDRMLRYAGGREKNLGEYQVLGLMSGIDSMLIGNYLTTCGQSLAEDFAMIKESGLTHQALMDG